MEEICGIYSFGKKIIYWQKNDGENWSTQWKTIIIAKKITNKIFPKIDKNLRVKSWHSKYNSGFLIQKVILIYHNAEPIKSRFVGKV